MRNYADRRNMEIIGVYEDDGYSAGNFNRPAWRRMVKDIRRKRPDVILCLKYNRIARIAGEGLVTIETIERRNGCVFVSVEEMAFVDIHSPYFYKMRGEIFVTSEFERRVISTEAKKGRRRGLMLGHFLNKPPYGYLKSPAGGPKNVPVKDAQAAASVEAIGRMYHIEKMRTWTEITRRARKLGFALKGRSAAKNIIYNPMYYGLVRYPALFNEPAGITEALHEPYYPREWWDSLQRNEPATVQAVYKMQDPALPHRGQFLGTCGHALTGAASRSGNGTYIHYYKCNTCKGQNNNAGKLHAKMRVLLDCIQLNEADIAKLRQLVEANLEQVRKEIAQQRARIERDIVATKKRIDVMDERFLTTNAIKEVTYTEHRGKAEQRLAGLEIELEEIDQRTDRLDLSVLDVYAQSAADKYEQMTPSEKQVFTGELFGKIIIENGNYRTSKAPEFFKARMLETNYLSLLPSESPSVSNLKSLGSAPNGHQIEPVKELIGIAQMLLNVAA